MNRAIVRYIKRNYKELNNNKFFKENSNYIEEHLNNLTFNSPIMGPLKTINKEDFYRLIDEFFKKYYGDSFFMESINTKILIYSKEQLLEFIEYSKTMNIEGIMKSKVTISTEECLKLLESFGVFLYPIYEDYWQIHLLDFNTIETILNAIHEYTHKIHYYILGEQFHNDTDIITEMLAYYNEALFAIYLIENKVISSLDLNIALSRTEEEIKEEMFYSNICSLINIDINLSKLNSKEKEGLIKYYKESYFPPKDYSHHLGYALFKEAFLNHKDYTLKEHTNFLRNTMIKRKIKDLSY